jgi:hypothetical protein
MAWHPYVHLSASISPSLCASFGGHEPAPGFIVIREDCQSLDPVRSGESLNGPGRAQRPHGPPAGADDGQSCFDTLGDAEAVRHLIIGRELDGSPFGASEHLLRIAKSWDVSLSGAIRLQCSAMKPASGIGEDVSKQGHHRGQPHNTPILEPEGALRMKAKRLAFKGQTESSAR